MHDFDDLIFFISSFDSNMFDISNVVREDQKQCGLRLGRPFLGFNSVLGFCRLLGNILHVLKKNIVLTLWFGSVLVNLFVLNTL
jgi:hypothetical protein